MVDDVERQVTVCRAGGKRTVGNGAQDEGARPL